MLFLKFYLLLGVGLVLVFMIEVSASDWWFGRHTLIHDLLFLPIFTIESAVGKRLITHCCVSRLACSRLSGHIEPHSPRLQACNQHNYGGHELS